MRADCIICGKKKLDKNTIGINKKLLGEDIEKIEEFKEEGCKLFE